MQSNLWSLGRAACREIIWCTSFVHFWFNRQGNRIVNKTGDFVNLEKDNSRQCLSSICTLSDRLICYCPCDMIFFKKLCSLPHTYFKILCLTTRAHFSLCFQLKLMTWIPVLLLPGFKNVRPLSDFLFFLLRKKKMKLSGFWEVFDFASGLMSLQHIGSTAKTISFSCFCNHEDYNIPFFPCNQKLGFSGDFSVSWSLGFMRTVRHGEIHAM